MNTEEFIKMVSENADLLDFLIRFRKEAPLSEEKVIEIFSHFFDLEKLYGVDFDEVANAINQWIS